MATRGQHLEIEQFLQEIPLFSSLSRDQLRDIASCFCRLYFRKDAVIFRQGDVCDAMYIVRSGSVAISATRDGQLLVQTELRRGEFFGEMALLSEMPRNAEARVVLDATLFCLKKVDFQVLLQNDKHIGLFLSRLYARRLAIGQEKLTERRQAIFYTISATDPGLGLSHFLYSMAYHVVTESKNKVLIVEPHLELESIMRKLDLHAIVCPHEDLFEILPAALYKKSDFRWFFHSSGFIVLQVKKGFCNQLAPILPQLMESFQHSYNLIVFSLGHYFRDLEQNAVRLCDKNLLLINNTTAALEAVRKKLQRLEATAGIGLDRVRVGVSHLCGSRGIAREQLRRDLYLAEIPQIWVERSEKAVNDQIDTEKRFPVKGARAVAREIAGVRTGIALGAGAARGWAHIGVLQVLEDEGIPIDMIAGTSMGALVAAIFAASGSVAALREQTIARFTNKRHTRRGIFDYTLPLRGLLRGRKAMNLVATAINDADFMDLLIPTYLVGVDIVQGEEVVFETGDVARAVRASMSLPVVFSPFLHQGRWMVDGGLLNPLPIDILLQKGADRIVAVCVEGKKPYIEPSRRAPGILQVISRTIAIVHGRATSGVTKKSDVVICPDVQGFAWDDFHRGEVLMQRGVDACRAVIGEIKEMVR